jgi:IclR family KDG regulon transcriptional repressor
VSTATELLVADFPTQTVAEVAAVLDDAPASDSSALKALILLEAVAAAERSGVSELASRATLAKSTAFRLLGNLVDAGFVGREGTSYVIGERMSMLARSVWSPKSGRLRDMALPYLQDLYELTHEVIHLAVLDGVDVVYLEKLYGHRSARTPSAVGGRFPARCSAVGKALAANAPASVRARVQATTVRPRTRYTIMAPAVLRDELDQVRTAGIAFDHEEAALGLTCVAAPIFAGDPDLAVAAISVAGASSKIDDDRLAPLVLRSASLISAVLART